VSKLLVALLKLLLLPLLVFPLSFVLPIFFRTAAAAAGVLSMELRPLLSLEDDRLDEAHNRAAAPKSPPPCDLMRKKKRGRIKE